MGSIRVIRVINTHRRTCESGKTGTARVCYIRLVVDVALLGGYPHFLILFVVRVCVSRVWRSYDLVD